MKIIKPLGVMAVLLISGVFSLAQQNDKSTFKSGNLNKRMFSFDGESGFNFLEEGVSWKVKILTGGGIIGSGKGNLILTSDGNFSKNESQAAGKIFNQEILQSLTELVSKVQITEQATDPDAQQLIRATSISWCKDCYTTTFILIRREADGKLKRITATWDITTKGQVAAEVLQVYGKVSALLDTKK